MEVVFTLRHHPQHLRFFILAQTDRTRRISSATKTVGRRGGGSFGEVELRVRVYDGLVKSHVDVTRFEILFRDEDYAREDNACASFYGGFNGGCAAARVAATDVGG